MEVSGEGILAGWCDWQRARGLAETTVVSRLSAWRSWWAYCGESVEVLLGADHNDVEAWIRGRTLGDRARYRAVSDLASLYKWLRREGLVDGSPLELVDRPRLHMRLPRPARRGQVAQALAHEERTPGVHVVIALMAYAGLRCCEVARLTWADVDLVGAQVFVTGKGERDRYVPLSPILIRHLVPLDGSVGLVWARATGEARTPGRVSQDVNGHLRSAGLRITAHRLRHYYATRMLELAKGDLTAVQHLLGHSSVSTTQGYTGLVPGAGSRAAKLWTD